MILSDRQGQAWRGLARRGKARRGPFETAAKDRNRR